jgi:hypothetical protein
MTRRRLWLYLGTSVVLFGGSLVAACELLR